MKDFIIQISTAILGSLGFCIIFKMKRRRLFLASLGSGLTCLFYMLCMHFGVSLFTSNLIATIFASFYAHIMSIINKTPRTIFRITAVVPLLPGSSLYYSMSAAVHGLEEEALYYAYQTGIVAGAIAFGMLLYTAVRHIFRIKKNKKKVTA